MPHNYNSENGRWSVVITDTFSISVVGEERYHQWSWEEDTTRMEPTNAIQTPPLQCLCYKLLVFTCHLHAPITNHSSFPVSQSAKRNGGLKTISTSQDDRKLLWEWTFILEKGQESRCLEWEGIAKGREGKIKLMGSFLPHYI